MKTLDAGLVIIQLEQCLNALPIGTGRKLSKAVAAAEAIQLIGGFSSPSLLTKASPNFHQFAEQDGSFHGAYGNRIRHQALNVVTKLREDPDSRQAIITLWDPVLDNVPGKKDYPCTVALQFSVAADGALDMTTFMRSNDVWRGLPYDMFQFTQLQMSIANALTLSYGSYTHIAASLHLYEENVDAAKHLHATNNFEWQPVGFGTRDESMTTIMRRARTVTTPGYDVPVHTPSEEWYRDIFTSYLGR